MPRSKSKDELLSLATTNFNKLFTKTIYKLNDLERVEAVTIKDESGNILSYSSYDYSFRK